MWAIGRKHTPVADRGKSVLRDFGYIKGLTLLAIACSFGSDFPAQAQIAACRPKIIDSIPLQYADKHYYLEAQIDGTDVRLLLDTGARRTTITHALAEQLSLPRSSYRSIVIGESGTRSSPTYDAIIPAFRIGRRTIANYQVIVDGTEHRPNANFQGLIGADVLFNSDVEFDFPNRQLIFHEIAPCVSFAAPWSAPSFSFAVERSVRTGRPLVEVQVNGRLILGLLDTGSSNTVIERSAALEIGASAAALDQGKSSVTLDANEKGFVKRRFAFSEFNIGPEHFKNVRVYVGDTDFGEARMLLGADYLRSHKLWVSLANGRMYVMPPSPVPALRLSRQ